jgi:hypothetical protein
MRIKIDYQYEKKRYRLIDVQKGEIAVNENGTPLDGGGHADINKALRQSGYINKYYSNKKG